MAASLAPASGLYFSMNNKVAMSGIHKLRNIKSQNPRRMYAKITVIPNAAMFVLFEAANLGTAMNWPKKIDCARFI